MDKNSKIYVAGHLGMVGSALLKNLRQKGYSRFILRSIDELDLTDPHAVARLFREEQPEYVFLAAAKVGGIVANNTYRGQFIYENLMIQNNIIHQSYVHGVKKLLFLGSTCIYPREAPQPMQEDCLMTGPLEYTNEPYALAKIAGLKMCESYNLQYNTNFIAVMPTNLYGPNDNFNLETSHVLPAMLRKIHLGKCLMQNDWTAIRADLDRRPVEGVSGAATEPEILAKLNKYGIRVLPGLSDTTTQVQVEIWGTGTPMREFLWSEEMADACVFIMEKVSFADLARDKGREIRNCHINIGSGKEVSIGDLARMIAEAIGFTGELYFNPDKPDGTMRKLTDPSKLHALGWHHQIELPEGIRKMYQHYLA